MPDRTTEIFGTTWESEPRRVVLRHDGPAGNLNIDIWVDDEEEHSVRIPLGVFAAALREQGLVFGLAFPE